MSETPNPPGSPDPPSPAPEPSQPSNSGVPPASPTPLVPPTPPASVPGTDSTMAAATVAAGPGMGDPADVEKNKVYALLSYIYLLWLVPLLAAKDSPFAKFHCNQGIVLSIITFAVYIGVAIISFIPYVGCLGCVLWPLLLLGHLAYMIIGVINAVNGKMKPLPLFPPITLVK